MMRCDSRILVLGRRGLVGGAVARALAAKGYSNVFGPTSVELDLRDQAATRHYLAQERPDAIVLAAARVGGIFANQSAPVPFLMDNLAIEHNVLHAAAQEGVRRLVFLASSCIYPKWATIPLRPTDLMSGRLEPTNRWYAVAKLAGIYMCQAYKLERGLDYVSVLPTNVYGPGDTYDETKSHVIPGLILKLHNAKTHGWAELGMRGSGMARREFIYADDLGRAIVRVLERYHDSMPLNIGVGVDITVRELADKVGNVVGWPGMFRWEADSLCAEDGTPRKLLDSRPMRDLGWAPEVSLEDGLRHAYMDFEMRRGLSRNREGVSC